jgi:hypothetical protein
MIASVRHYNKTQRKWKINYYYVAKVTDNLLFLTNRKITVRDHHTNLYYIT